MELSVHGKQMDVGNSLREHVEGKLEDLNSKYFNHAAFATVTFSKEGHGKPQTKVHISIQIGKNLLVVADAMDSDPYASFEQAATKVGKQMRRYKKKIRDHHERVDTLPEEEIINANDYVLAAAPEQNDEPDGDVPQGDDPVVIAEMKKEIMTLSVSDAVMHLDLSGEQALLFRNAKHGGCSMVYRRKDGNIGWVDAESLK
ncbi:MAG: ribosome-associated translation inhibitor RaiA [Micavibrio sp.]|nr:ribosome-associated translation inhibitor RaiA [Micavibrio sp.]